MTVLASKMTHKSAKNRLPKNDIMTCVSKLVALRGIVRHFYALLMHFRIRKWSRWTILTSEMTCKTATITKNH